jgi:hypothetical protein
LTMPARDTERVILDVCRALETEHAGRRRRWANMDALHARLPGLAFAQLDAAIAVARSRGWIDCGGRPVHRLLLTESGRVAIRAK